MKAFLLAAGLGTRLRPLTLTVPKCLVPIHSKPLLQWWVELFSQHGIREVMINTHYLREPVAEFIRANNSSGSGVTLHEAYEPELSGSGGMVRDNRNFVDGEDGFMIAYADNLTDANLTAFREFHRDTCLKNGGLLSMALFRANHPEQCGIASLDDDMSITAFTEKPAHPSSSLANAGIYIASPEIFSYIPREGSADFGKDVLPRLVGKMYGWETDGYLLDIGTPENYSKAQQEWRH
ncbi:MAG: nucleotidyltransferase family protein [Synergistaceae bacterium]|nr:nucleotidyltransferase family protein [Synergistaceae bacterium]MBQ6970785.1 nucleotidyltransferase family protein [Synergistaceae bacterium]